MNIKTFKEIIEYYYENHVKTYNPGMVNDIRERLQKKTNYDGDCDTLSYLLFKKFDFVVNYKTVKNRIIYYRKLLNK